MGRHRSAVQQRRRRHYRGAAGFSPPTSEIVEWLRFGEATGSGDSLVVPEVLAGGSAIPGSAGLAPALSLNGNGLTQVEFDETTPECLDYTFGRGNYSAGIGFATWFKAPAPISVGETVLTAAANGFTRAFRFTKTTVAVDTYDLEIGNAGQLQSARFTSSLVDDGDWHFLIMTYFGAEAASDDRIQIWIDGSAISFTSVNIVGDPLFPTTTVAVNDMSIGARDPSGTAAATIFLGPNLFLTDRHFADATARSAAENFESMAGAA